MRNAGIEKADSYQNRSGIVLLVTLVLLVVLSTLGYTLTTRVAARRHRDHYLVNYSKARYACDSAVKYALATLQDINTPQLIARPNEPDFSDLFSLSELEYEQLLTQWADERQQRAMTDEIESPYNTDYFNEINDINDINSINDVNYIGPDEIETADFNDPNSLTISGPYGPPWPFITKPTEFEIGSAKVRIEIEDENAKYPIGWAMLEGEGIQREAAAGLEIFCEWMDVNDVQIDSLKKQLEEISEIKTFKLKFKPIKKTIASPKSRASRSRRRRSRSRLSKRSRRERTTTTPASVHTADFAKLFHSSLIDSESLARPTIISESRKESPLKYMGMWASSKVNINTAPRHVLEAAFVFGGDEVEIAEGIIQRRRIKPFENIEDLKKALFRYSNSIDKCKNYITTTSDLFTIKVTAVTGTSKASTIIAIRKNGKKLEPIAVISG